MDLSNNITSANFFGLLSLESLNLNGNGLTLIDLNFFSILKNFVNLNLSNNLITNIFNEAFEVNKELRSIDLSNNQLKVLYPKTFEHYVDSAHP